MGRLERLLDRPARFRAVIEGDGAARKVNLWLAAGRGEFNGHCVGHDLPQAISTACERIRSQLIRRRGKKESGRQKTVA
jgi:ribosome-associated translation inhibitor RaiA